MRSLPADSVDAIVSDPPYGLAFMGKEWDHGVPGVEFWREALRVAKPGAHLVAFGGTRTFHRLAVAIEDAGWEVRDCLSWLYGSGFPKSLDVGKAIDKMDAAEEQMARRYRFTEWVRLTGVTSKQIDEATATNMGGHYTTAASQPAIMTREHLEACRHLLGDIPEWVERECDIRSVESRNFAEREVVGSKAVTRVMDGTEYVGGTVRAGLVNVTAPATDAAKQWDGWGTALKPAYEPIILARKPLVGTVAANVTQYRTGGINVDECRIGYDPKDPRLAWQERYGGRDYGSADNDIYAPMQSRTSAGNPAGRWPANVCFDEDAAAMLDAQTGVLTSGSGNKNIRNRDDRNAYGNGLGAGNGHGIGGDSGGASRFFFVARKGQCDNVNDAEPTLGQPSVPVDFALSDAVTHLAQEKCEAGQASIAACACCTPLHNPASSVEPMGSIATTQTTPTFCESCGSARPAIDASINQESVAREEGVNVPVSGTRFLYSPKASRREREAGLDGMPERPAGSMNRGEASGRDGTNPKNTVGSVGDIRLANFHPTVKPIALMRWLCRLVTPPGGLVLDPFNGSGSTGCAAVLEGFRYLGAELDAEYVEIARKRIAHWAAQTPDPDLFG
jgi:hypothetical protein